MYPVHAKFPGPNAVVSVEFQWKGVLPSGAITCKKRVKRFTRGVILHYALASYPIVTLSSADMEKTNCAVKPTVHGEEWVFGWRTKEILGNTRKSYDLER